MAERKPQTYANHVRFHPPFHFVLMPSVLLGIGLSIWNLTRDMHSLPAWILLLMSLQVFLLAFLSRINPLKAQDRLIRLEEQLRMAQVLPEGLRSRAAQLTEGQLVALRFASDGELPQLVTQTLERNLKGREIKKLIQVWRPDYFRV